MPNYQPKKIFIQCNKHKNENKGYREDVDQSRSVV